MTLRRTGWALVAVALSAAVCAAAQYAGPKVTLKQRFPTGTYQMTMSMNGEQTTTVDGQAQPTQQMSQSFVMSMVVGEPDKDGARTMQMGFTQVKQNITMGAQTMAYDSTGPADKQDANLARTMGPMVKARIDVKIGADDKIQSATGLNAMWDQMAKDTPEMARFAEQMKGQMGDAAIKEMVTKAADMFPAQPVGPGDEWKPILKFNIPVVGELEIKQTCKLLDVETAPAGKTAVIQYDGTAQSTKETTTTMGGGSMTINSLSFTQTGQMRFNIDTGMTDTQVMNQDGTMDMTVPAPDGKTAKVSSKQKMKMETMIP
jgi:hypothetical protein